jgi:hypothetical protein
MVPVITVPVNQQSVHDGNDLHKRLGPDMLGRAGTRLPEERECVCRVAHLLSFRKLSALLFTYYPSPFVIRNLKG